MPARKPIGPPKRQSEISQLARLFSERLRSKRQERDLSQSELAEAASVGATYISELERGRNEPTLAVVEKLAAALGVEPADMLRQPKQKK